MLFMVIERLHEGKGQAFYAGLQVKARMMPGRLNYVNSSIDEDLTTFYPVVETQNKRFIHDWIRAWHILADFKVIPVLNRKKQNKK